MLKRLGLLSFQYLRTNSPLTQALRPAPLNGFNRYSTKEISFETASDETLESLCEHMEAIIDDTPKLAEADVTLASGVLTLSLPEPFGTYVINKQSPNKQIWLSSPKSGPIRYDFQDSAWVYKYTQESLHQLLNREIGQDILGVDDAGFENLYLGSKK